LSYEITQKAPEAERYLALSNFVRKYALLARSYIKVPEFEGLRRYGILAGTKEGFPTGYHAEDTDDHRRFLIRTPKQATYAL
jgi:hypothetical protein